MPNERLESFLNRGLVAWQRENCQGSHEDVDWDDDRFAGAKVSWGERQLHGASCADTVPAPRCAPRRRANSPSTFANERAECG